MKNRPLSNAAVKRMMEHLPDSVVLRYGAKRIAAVYNMNGLRIQVIRGVVSRNWAVC